jgi:hypothetical protein
MAKSGKLLNALAIVTGAFLLTAGIWGLSSKLVFGIFTTNAIHAAIHLILGVIGIVVGIRHNAHGFCILLSVLLGIVGILYFIPVAGSYVIQFLDVNAAAAYLYIVLAIVLPIAAALDKRSVNAR